MCNFIVGGEINLTEGFYIEVVFKLMHTGTPLGNLIKDEILVIIVVISS